MTPYKVTRWLLLWGAVLSISGPVAGTGPESEKNVGGSAGRTRPPTDREGRPCAGCHDAIVNAFAGTRMAGAASGSDYLAEWAEKGKVTSCLNCHAPSGNRGLGCADCHGSAGHPYPRVEVPEACARCHDAPGENTVRGFLRGPAPARGQDCLSCHVPDTSPGQDHRFQGPSAPGFLEGVASLRAFLRWEEAPGTTAIIQITHKAGHSLPGGTTGRSVWLVVAGCTAEGGESWRETARFGWEHHPDRGWLDRTLPAGGPAVIELPHSGRGGAVRLRAELWYRFRPGPIDEPDPRALMLSAVDLLLGSPEEPVRESR